MFSIVQSALFSIVQSVLFSIVQSALFSIVQSVLFSIVQSALFGCQVAIELDSCYTCTVRCEGIVVILFLSCLDRHICRGWVAQTCHKALGSFDNYILPKSAKPGVGCRMIQ